jgi:hypothetical protein
MIQLVIINIWWLKEKSDIEQQHIINDAVAKFKQFNINVKENNVTHVETL